MADLDARVRAILDEDEDDDLVDYGDSPLPSPAKPPAAVAEAPVEVVPARSAVVDVEAARAMMEQARRDRDAETLRMAAENLPDDDDDDEDLWDDDDDDDEGGGEDQQAAMVEEDLDELLASDPTPPAPLPIPLAPQPQLGEKRSRDRVVDDVDMMDVEATMDDDENAAPAGPTTMNNTAGDDDDEEMRDQHTFVPLEESEVVLAEHICRKVREHKKHLVRLLIKQFGSALCEGALKETMRIEREGGSFVTLDGAGGTRRRLPGGVFIMTMKQRAPAVDFKAVMKRSGEIDKALKKQLEARGPAPPRKRTKVDHQSLGGGGGRGGGGGGGRGGGRGGRGGRDRGRRGGRGGRGRGGREGGRGGGGTGGAPVTTYAVDI